MNRNEAIQHIQATLTAFDPGEAINLTQDTWANLHAAMTALVEQPEQEPMRAISAEQLSKMLQTLEGIDQNQWGYHWRCGWNDALRRAMDYCQAAPTPRRPVELTDGECDEIYDALDDWAREIDSYEFGLPRISGGGAEGGRVVIRRALGITGESK